MKVKIKYERIRDGEKELSEYEGHYRKTGVSENISFTEAETKTKHLLKIRDDNMKWTRSVDINGRSFSNELEFGEGVADILEYVTPHGKICMDVSTKKYKLLRDEGSGLPRIELEYDIWQTGTVVSEYKVTVGLCILQ